MRLNTWRYRLTRDPQEALRRRLRDLAAVRVRFGYRRLTVLLRREGWKVNPKRIYRLYGLEGLTVRTKPRKKLASRARVPQPRPTRPNQRWSMDFVSALQRSLGRSVAAAARGRDSPVSSAASCAPSTP